ncbi:N-6 DNA methylase [Microbacterium sp.]|uniref:N-6 DNA methylase n=1 Tax=Microbacterium sp. TaxID=51671 RepID=UPI002C838662|nr:N-6 DNA methylase [Microbacterium sp.]HWL76086.1 N-6 DNA methylase [Microbacterium sp.]
MDARDARRVSFSASKVSQVIRALIGDHPSERDVRRRWLEAVAVRTTASRPDLSESIREILGVGPVGEDYLKGLTIGEVGVCYEALLALMHRDDRRSSGQFFTPDDAAQFMAKQSLDFDEGHWLDPCCGVGNLSWHLTSVQVDPGAFVRDRLTLVDLDDAALRTAIVLIGSDWADAGDQDALRSLSARSQQRDFLSSARVPAHDYVIVNPPYARAKERSDLETGRTRDLFAYFLERVALTSRGFIAVTPASYLAASKFQPLRDVIDRIYGGGHVFAFDNVPDTLFRGYKFGSKNTSKTNFVRAAVTVCAPAHTSWKITPIIRWQAAEREAMFSECHLLLAPRRIGPHGEWAKLGPGMEAVWDSLQRAETVVADLVVNRETPWALDVGLTPRYYISATYRRLDRASKATLFFADEEARDRAALVLNSSLPYLWWRALDGGVTLPRRVLMSTPVPDFAINRCLIAALRDSEARNLVVKLNAGRENQNVKHPEDLVRALDRWVLRGEHDTRLLYASNMFPLARISFLSAISPIDKGASVGGVRKQRVRQTA